MTGRNGGDDGVGQRFGTALVSLVAILFIVATWLAPVTVAGHFAIMAAILLVWGFIVGQIWWGP